MSYYEIGKAELAEKYDKTLSFDQKRRYILVHIMTFIIRKNSEIDKE